MAVFHQVVARVIIARQMLRFDDRFQLRRVAIDADARIADAVLERSGILARRVIPSSQVAVEYSITPLGRTLEGPFTALFLWTITHSGDVLQAQAAFDQRV